MLTDIHSHDPLKVPNQSKVFSIQLLPDMDVDALLKTLPSDLWISAGVHPWNASEWASANVANLEVKLNSSQIVFLGEIGLDKVCGVPLTEQMSIFEEQLRFADKHSLSVLIHNVGYQAEVLKLKSQFKQIPAWILHGFRGNFQTAQNYLNHGFYLSFGSKYQLEALRLCPMERLFLESDDSKTDLGVLYANVAQDKSTTVEELETRLAINFESIRRK